MQRAWQFWKADDNPKLLLMFMIHVHKHALCPLSLKLFHWILLPWSGKLLLSQFARLPL